MAAKLAARSTRIEAGVGGVYDRHDYLKEKTEAAEAWGRHIEGIIGDDPKVVQMVQPEAS